jgi:hypothetical protein
LLLLFLDKKLKIKDWSLEKSKEVEISLYLFYVIFKLIILWLGSTAKAPMGARDREDENLIAKLYEENTKLKSQISALSDKNKRLLEQMEKKKQELVLAQRKLATIKQNNSIASASSKDRPFTAPPIEAIPAPTPHQKGLNLSNENNINAALTDMKLLEVARTYKARYFFHINVSKIS